MVRFCFEYPLRDTSLVADETFPAIPPPAKVDLTGVLATLEQQSTLISTLASQIQTQQAHRSDHFVPLLEGQQALLDRFDQFDETRETVANELERLNSAVNGRNTEEAERLQRLLDHELLALSTERETGAQQLQTRLSAENSENKRLRGEVKRTAQELQLANQDVHSLRQQLGDATNATDAALAARKHQSDLELANAKANNERLQADLLHAQTQQLEAAKKRIGSIESNDQKVTIALAELRAVITASSDQLANRVTSLETRVEERQPSSAVLEAAPSVQGVSAEESAHLHEEVCLLVATYRHPDYTKTKADWQMVQLREKDRTRQLDAQRHHLELEKLQLQLENEKIARTKADEQVMKLEGWYREEIDKRATAEVIARERTYVAQLQEVCHVPGGPNNDLYQDIRLQTDAMYDRPASHRCFKMSITGARSQCLLTGMRRDSFSVASHSRVSTRPTSLHATPTDTMTAGKRRMARPHLPKSHRPRRLPCGSLIPSKDPRCYGRDCFTFFNCQD